jgi:hypothetical protein
MFLTGRRIGGEQAVEWGLADVLAPLADVRKEAMKLAAEIAESAPLGRACRPRETCAAASPTAPRSRPSASSPSRTGRARPRTSRRAVKSYAEKRAGQLEGPLMPAAAGKGAIVTGRRVRHRRACPETLAREGASVLITDIDDALGKAVVERIRKAGGKARYLHHDVRDEAAWPGVIAEARSTSAGSTSWSPMPASASCRRSRP